MLRRIHHIGIAVRDLDATTALYRDSFGIDSWERISLPERHMEVADAYIRGLERLVEAGGDPATVGSVASYFVSRVDTEADRRLDEAGLPRGVKVEIDVIAAF